MKIEEKYKELNERKSDINEHFPVLKMYAEKCDHVTEMGVRKIISTWALLSGYPKQMVSIDIKHPNHFGGNLDEVIEAVKDKIDYKFKLEDTTKNEIEETDLLFIDTWHHYEQLKSELRHSSKVRKYIILHDTKTFGIRGENGGEGLKKAINEFLENNKEWVVEKEYENNNGLTILARINNEGYNMKFLIPIPDRDYYAWQMLVQLANFRSLGYEADLTYLIGYKKKLNPNVQRIIDSKKFLAKFVPIEDTRNNSLYPPNMAIHIAGKFFKDNPEYGKEQFMYLDPDIIFTRKVDFTKYSRDIWYGSNVVGYIGAGYIKSKGDALLTEMCRVAKIPRNFVETTKDVCIGGQYIMCNVDHTYWEDVYKMSEELYKHMKDTSKTYNPEKPIQAWTASMWAMLWEAWKRSIRTETSDDIDKFTWAHYARENWNKHCIFHNAGVIDNKDNKHFKKTAYTTSPFKKEITVSQESASFKYLEWVKKTELMFPDLIW